MGTESKISWQAIIVLLIAVVFITQMIAFIAGIDGVVTAACYGTWGLIAGAVSTIMVVVVSKKKSNDKKEKGA